MIENLITFTNFIYAFLFTVPLILYLKNRNSPPGPYGLPIFGYYPFLGKDPVETIHKLGKKYGEIISINLFGETFWILNSYEAIEEAFVAKGDIFAGRPSDEYSFINTIGNKSIANTEGEEWSSHSKFALGHLSELGMGKTQFEVTMHNVFEEIEKHIDKHNEKPNDYSLLMSEYAMNVITSLVCSKSYTHEDPFFVKLEQTFRTTFSVLGYFNIYLSGNIFKYYVKMTSDDDKIASDCYKELRKYAKSLIEEKEATFDENNCRDLIDYWMKECKRTGSEYFDRERMEADIANFLVAGTETSAAFLNASLYLMAENRNVQRRVYEEIRDNVGVDGLFCYLDRDRLPYTQAVLAEIHRYLVIAPLGTFHATRSETTLRGYRIPKRQKVLGNWYSLTRDPKIFANPNEFDPSNFLDKNDHFKPNRALLPFGIGPRKCTGFKLAEIEIFIGFVRLMRRYEWSFPDDAKNENPFTLGSFRFPNPFKVYAKRYE